MARQKLGELLVNAGVLTSERLEHALVKQRDSGRKLGQLLVELRFVTESQVAQTLSMQLSIPWVALQHIEFSPALLDLVPSWIAERYGVIPVFVRKVRQQGETLYVATDDPTNDAALAEVSQVTALPVRPMIACTSDVKRAIQLHYGPADAGADGLTDGSLNTAITETMKAAPAHPLSSDAHVDSQTDVTSHPPLSAATTDSMQAASVYSPVSEPLAPGVSDSGDSPDADPEIEAREIIRKPSHSTAGSIALTFLDGTTIKLPAKRKKTSTEESPSGAPQTLPPTSSSPDLLATIRSITGAESSPDQDNRPNTSETMMLALLTILKRKGIVLEPEFLDELRHSFEKR